jgi:hypothetical protein
MSEQQTTKTEPPGYRPAGFVWGLRIPVKATMHSGAWRPLDPVDDDQGGA